MILSNLRCCDMHLKSNLVAHIVLQGLYQSPSLSRWPSPATPCEGWDYAPPWPTWSYRGHISSLTRTDYSGRNACTIHKNHHLGLWWKWRWGWWRCSLPPWPPLSPINPMWWTIKNVGHQHSLQCCTKSRDAWSGPGPRRVPQSTWPVSTCPSTWGSPCPTIWSSSELMEDRLKIPDKAAALLRDQVCMCSLDPNGRSMGPMRDHQLWLSSSWYIFYSSDTVTSF